ncbi:MAG: hypothetical protein A3H98_06350 [Bacteroidetes bacterium RIFCSPLOWO2_02_FULL_36_8]|nr:MAG: hypothetical protein A3H98_06350 [Bacteroidetes bacterium RIFCSPLOWO2_02_FULL_36_8]OFY71197.1 MAG: hypothetical protein A3G23_10495 [Bacteroidetes bacterium RIFCSPLOWO2_12_FULL_37_12]
MTRIFGFILTGLLLFLTSCDNSRIYEKNTDIEDFIWNKGNKILHEFTVEDTSLSYNLIFNIRHTIHYQFQNIYIQYELKAPDGQVITKLENIRTADVLNEKWVGEILGDIIDLSSPVTGFQNHKFKIKGNYRVSLEQFMRVDHLIGVMSVGVRLEKNIK